MTAGPVELATSLGPPLVLQDGVWTIELGELGIVHGLSVLSRALAEVVVARCRPERFELVAERKLRARENPELVNVYGIDHVRIAIDGAVADDVQHDPTTFERRLRTLLGSLQRTRYREALLPEDRAASQALLAEFGDGPKRLRFLLEQVARRDGGWGAFRITVEPAMGARTDVSQLPHLVIDDVEDRQFIAGSTRIAETWAEAVRREAERGRRSFHEGRSAHSHLFHQLDQAGLSALQRVSLRWSATAQTYLLESVPSDVAHLLKRVLLACEDRQVRRLLAERAVVRVDSGPLQVYLDEAQLGRVLELSLGRRRERRDVDDFLRRMPAMSAVVAAAEGAQPLAGVHVFFVHHMTAEIVATIGALRALGCRDLVTLFVAYSGEPPASYLDAVLDLTPDEFRALALVNVPERGHVEGRYRLSEHYSQLDEAPAIAAALRRHDGEYLPAMRAAAVVSFLAMCARAEAAGERVLIIEDGGYLAPPLHDALLDGRTLGEFATLLGHCIDDPRPLTDVVGMRLIATIEHTRNGFDRIAEVEARRGRLATPAYSIAISRLKREVESREVSASLLNAAEAVLNAEGLVLARRHALVIGSLGAIGSELVRGLSARLDDPTAQLVGVDIAATSKHDGCATARTLGEHGRERWLATDLVVGVAGCSVLQADDIEAWLLDSTRAQLTLVSGSTKKVEFRDLMLWLDRLVRSDAPTIAGRAVAIAVDEMLDPRSARLYGHRWCFTFDDGRVRTVLATGELTPLNFLFYGVATELIDEVLAQLVTVTLGGLARGSTAESRLLAVDRDVDAHGRPR